MQACFHPFGFIFERNRPARRFRRKSENLALSECVDFYDRAIGLIGEIMTNTIQFVDRAQDSFDRISELPAFAARQAELLEQRKKF